MLRDPLYAVAVANTSCVYELPNNWFQQPTCQNKVLETYQGLVRSERPTAPMFPRPRPHGSLTFWTG